MPRAPHTPRATRVRQVASQPRARHPRNGNSDDNARRHPLCGRPPQVQALRSTASHDGRVALRPLRRRRRHRRHSARPAPHTVLAGSSEDNSERRAGALVCDRRLRPHGLRRLGGEPKLNAFERDVDDVRRVVRTSATCSTARWSGCWATAPAALGAHAQRFRDVKHVIAVSADAELTRRSNHALTGRSMQTLKSDGRLTVERRGALKVAQAELDARPALEGLDGSAQFLVLCGSLDDLVPVEEARALVELIGSASAEPRIIPGTGHDWSGQRRRSRTRRAILFGAACAARRRRRTRRRASGSTTGRRASTSLSTTCTRRSRRSTPPRAPTCHRCRPTTTTTTTTTRRRSSRRRCAGCRARR